MNPRDYFPLGKAQGHAFCNRESETEWLLKNLKAGKHSLLIAARRFGKSSLAERAVEFSKLPMICLNFNICSTEQDVELLIRQGVSLLISKSVGSVEKIIHSIKNYVQNFTPKLVIGNKLTHLELTTNQHNNVSANVEESLNLLEKLLKEKKHRAILLLDEFQTVGLIAKGAGVEAAIRNVAQDLKHLTLIFSGSNRGLLTSMFENEARPLYKLCRKLQLNRIEKHHYQKHLNHAAKLAWKQELHGDVFENIMQLTERHPYYVNYLCDVLWTENERRNPTIVDVKNAWRLVIEEERSDANAEIAALSMGQKRVLKFIAQEIEPNLLSANAVKITGMALSSVATAITSLIEKDIIEKQENIYQIINPIIKNILHEGLIG